MRSLFCVFLLALAPNLWAQRGGTSSPNQETPTTESLTFVTMDFQAGTSVSGFVNQNGQNATFKGLNLGFDLNFIGSVTSANFAFGPFVHWHRGDLNSNVSINEVSQSALVQDVIYGLKFIIFPFYGGFGFGDLDIRLKSTEGPELNLRSKQLGFTAGYLGFKFSDSVYLGINGWYKNGFINAADNPTSENTKFDSWELYLKLTIYPAFELL